MTVRQKNHTLRYKWTLILDGSAPFIAEGEVVHFSCGVAYVHSRASGGAEEWLIIAGKKSWAYHLEMREWFTTVEKGISKADEDAATLSGMFSALRDHITSVNSAREERYGELRMKVYDFSIASAPMDKYLSGLLQGGKGQVTDTHFEGTEAHAVIVCGVEDRLIHKITFYLKCTLKTATTSAKRNLHIEADIDKQGTSEAPTFEYADAVSGIRKTITIPGPIKDAVDHQMSVDGGK
jgi:hypothetical protein